LSALGAIDCVIDFHCSCQKKLGKLFLVSWKEQTQIAYKGHLNKIGFDHVDIPDLGQEVTI